MNIGEFYNRLKIKFRIKRWEIIQSLIDKHGFKSYLEIGIATGQCFSHIRCEEKIGVDPNPKSNVLKMTSDEFFTQNKKTFDIVFIDGLHHSEQVIRDVENSLKVLNPGGFILLHDCNPFSEKMQRVPRETVIWSGDVWKAWMYFRKRKELSMYVVDADYGVGVIQKGMQEIVEVNEPAYADLARNRKQWLNLISVSNFRELTAVS